MISTIHGLLFSSIGLYADPRMVLRPVPWVTSEAVNFLETFMSEHPNASVLEFGSGSSTIWFAKRTENLVSLEHNPKWYQKVHGLLDSNPECNLVNLILTNQLDILFGIASHSFYSVYLHPECDFIGFSEKHILFNSIFG